jgi:branched-chain amino acid transport system substrate-binding protein
MRTNGRTSERRQAIVQLLRRPTLWVLVLAALLLIAAVACGGGEEEAKTPAGETPAANVTPGPGVSDTEIKLGQTNDLAGTGGTPYGVITTAMKAYFSKVNEEDGGVCGRSINLLAEDDQYAPDLALEKTKKLVEQDHVLGIVGALGTAAHLGAVDYLNDPNGDGDTSDGIPDLFVSTGYTGWTNYEMWPWTFGYIPDYASDAKILATYINDNFAGQKVGILYQNDPFGEDYLNGLKDNLDDPSLLVSEQTYEPGAPDLSSQVINIQNAGAEVVVLGAVPTASAAAIVAANAQGYNPQWMVSYVNAHTSLAASIGGGTNADQLAAGFALLDGTIANNYQLDAVGDKDDPAMVEHARIMETYGGPTVSTLSVYGQSLGETTVDALSGACDNLTREGLLQSVESMKDFHPSVFLPDITITYSATDHRAIEALQPVRIEADGTLTDLGGLITLGQ